MSGRNTLLADLASEMPEPLTEEEIKKEAEKAERLRKRNKLSGTDEKAPLIVPVASWKF